MQINRLARLGILLFGFVCQSAHAQAPTMQTAPPATPAKASDDPYAKEPYVFENLDNTLRFEADGKGQRDLSFRARIQSESALREFGLLAYPFASSFESLDVVYVRVRKPAGHDRHGEPSGPAAPAGPWSNIALPHLEVRLSKIL